MRARRSSLRGSTAREKSELYCHCCIRARARDWREHRDLQRGQRSVVATAAVYPDPDKLIVLRESSHIFDNGAVGYMNWLDWHAGQQSFTDIALVRRESVNFSVGAGQGSPERLRGVRASSGFLSVLGFKPKIGRDLNAADDVAGAPNVALISENLWRHDFGASPSVLGRRVLIDGLQREIIGVFPVELQFGRNPDVLLPLSEIAKEPWMLTRDYHQGFSGLGRLKPGVTISQATSDLNAIAIDLEKNLRRAMQGGERGCGRCLRQQSAIIALA